MPVGYKLVRRQFLPLAVLYSGAVDFPPKTASKSTLIVEAVVLGEAEGRGKPEKKSWAMKYTHEVNYHSFQWNQKVLKNNNNKKIKLPSTVTGWYTEAYVGLWPLKSSLQKERRK